MDVLGHGVPATDLANLTGHEQYPKRGRSAANHADCQPVPSWGRNPRRSVGPNNLTTPSPIPRPADSPASPCGGCGTGNRVGLIVPSIKRRLSEHNIVRLYSYQDLLVVSALRTERNMSLQNIRRVARHLRSRGYQAPLRELRFAPSRSTSSILTARGKATCSRIRSSLSRRSSWIRFGCASIGRQGVRLTTRAMLKSAGACTPALRYSLALGSGLRRYSGICSRVTEPLRSWNRFRTSGWKTSTKPGGN
jgi:hypothetical protein